MIASFDTGTNGFLPVSIPLLLSQWNILQLNFAWQQFYFDVYRNSIDRHIQSGNMIQQLIEAKEWYSHCHRILYFQLWL